MDRWHCISCSFSHGGTSSAGVDVVGVSGGLEDGRTVTKCGHPCVRAVAAKAFAHAIGEGGLEVREVAVRGQCLVFVRGLGYRRHPHAPAWCWASWRGRGGLVDFLPLRCGHVTCTALGAAPRCGQLQSSGIGVGEAVASGAVVAQVQQTFCLTDSADVGVFAVVVLAPLYVVHGLESWVIGGQGFRRSDASIKVGVRFLCCVHESDVARSDHPVSEHSAGRHYLDRDEVDTMTGVPSEAVPAAANGAGLEHGWLGEHLDDDLAAEQVKGVESWLPPVVRFVLGLGRVVGRHGEVSQTAGVREDIVPLFRGDVCS